MAATLRAKPARAKEIAAGTQMIFDAGVVAIRDLARNDIPPAPLLIQPASSDVENRRLVGTTNLGLSAANSDAKTLVLFLHGIGGNRKNWTKQLQCPGVCRQSGSESNLVRAVLWGVDCHVFCHATPR